MQIARTGVERPDAKEGVNGLFPLFDRCGKRSSSGTGSLRDDWLIELALLSDLAICRDELPYDVPPPLLLLPLLLLLPYDRPVSGWRAG